MAKQVGLVKYSGTMGGVRHFKIKGLNGDYAGLVGGPTTDQIYNDVAFARTRENMSEFGGCASAAKSIRVALSAIMKQFSDSRLTGRLTGIMKQINLEDIANSRGERGIHISSNQKVLVGMGFNENVSLTGIFNAPYAFTYSPSRDAGNLTIPSFSPSSLISAPAGATHFRIVNAIAVASDWTYNPSTGKYEPTDPDFNGKSDIQYSDYLDLNSITPSININTTLAVGSMPSSVSVLNCIGIEFYQQVGSNYYLFSAGNAMRIDSIF